MKKVKIVEVKMPDKIGNIYYDSASASLHVLNDCISKCRDLKFDIVRFRVSHEDMPFCCVECLSSAALELAKAQNAMIEIAKNLEEIKLVFGGKEL